MTNSRTLEYSTKFKMVAVFSIVFAALALASCSSKKKNPPPSPPTNPPIVVTSVDVAAQTADFVTASQAAKGVVVQFAAVANMSNTAKNNVTTTATWTSSDPTILAFEVPSVPGVATAKKEGAVTVSATDIDGVAGTLPYTVIAAAPASLAISPSLLPSGLPVGQKGDFEATLTMTDKTTSNATTAVNWSSSVGSVVVVGNEAGNKGKAVALAAGKSNVSATTDSLNSQNVEVTVFAPAAPPQFIVEPSSPSQLPLGGRQQFKALLKYSTGEVFDATASVAWQTSAANIANFPANETPGLLFANPTTPGSAMVTALNPTSGATTAPVTVEVTAPTLVSISFTPAGTAGQPLPVGTKRQLGLIATYSDNIPRDITQIVNWTAGGLGHLSVSNLKSTKGLVTANQETPAGTANDTVVVTDPVSGQSTSLAIQTTGRTVDKITISPITKQEVPLGETVQFTATAQFSDGTGDPVTKLVTWKSSASDKVAISNVAADKGKATALSVGESAITATYVINGETIASDNYGHVVVNAAALETIAIKPTDPVSLAIGRSQRLTAEGTFSDGAVRDISDHVNWTSQNRSIATVGTSGKDRGVVTGVSIGGPIAITVTEPRTNTVATKPVSVTGKAFDGITIFPAGPVSSQVGILYKGFSADASYSDGSGDPITEQVQWKSSNDAIAFVSNEPGKKGYVYPRAVGDVTITASAETLTSDPVTFQVAAGVLQSIALTPSAPQGINVGDTVQFSAVGSYSDGTDRNITQSVIFASNNVQAAVISNSATGRGRLVAVGGPGLAEVTASLGNVTSPNTSVVVAAQTAVTTVAQIKSGCCGGQQVTMQGRATSWNGGEDYTFEDATGMIELEWQRSPPITLNIEVQLTGLPESSGNEVDVTGWSPL